MTLKSKPKSKDYVQNDLHCFQAFVHVEKQACLLIDCQTCSNIPEVCLIISIPFKILNEVFHWCKLEQFYC